MTAYNEAPSKSYEIGPVSGTLALATFDYCIDQFNDGAMSFEEAMTAYKEVVSDNAWQDSQNEVSEYPTAVLAVAVSL